MVIVTYFPVIMNKGDHQIFNPADNIKAHVDTNFIEIMNGEVLVGYVNAGAVKNIVIQNTVPEAE